MNPEDLATNVRAVVESWVAEAGLGIEIPAELKLERPKSRDHGDYATNIALTLAKAARLAPVVIAAVLAPKIAQIFSEMSSVCGYPSADALSSSSGCFSPRQLTPRSEASSGVLSILRFKGSIDSFGPSHLSILLQCTIFLYQHLN